MLKVGDKVVCINTGNKIHFKYELELYKKYIIISSPFKLHKKYFIFIDKYDFPYPLDDFILLSEFRKQKINKIKCLLK